MPGSVLSDGEQDQIAHYLCSPKDYLGNYSKSSLVVSVIKGEP